MQFRFDCNKNGNAKSGKTEICDAKTEIRIQNQKKSKKFCTTQLTEFKNKLKSQEFGNCNA